MLFVCHHECYSLHFHTSSLVSVKAQSLWWFPRENITYYKCEVRQLWKIAMAVADHATGVPDVRSHGAQSVQANNCLASQNTVIDRSSFDGIDNHTHDTI